jgi:hypothetical protein
MPRPASVPMPADRSRVVVRVEADGLIKLNCRSRRIEVPTPVPINEPACEPRVKTWVVKTPCGKA